ncbi:MAG: DUF4837 family protein [Bacteroidales bacterium]|nr:DUF4837 family protein [Bacteroidales bacterium]
MRKMKHIITYASALILTVLALSSCKGSGEVVLPSIGGQPGEIAVVATKADWGSDLGNRVREILAQDYPYLPQTEPRYDLFNVPTNAFSKIFQVHRNLLFLNVGEDYPESKFVLNKDVWASPQTVVRVEAPTPEEALALLNENEAQLLAIFDQAERDRFMANAREFEDMSIKEQVTKLIGGSPTFPTGYSIKKISNNFIWISYETTYTNQSILLYTYPYESVDQFTAEEIAAKRNEVTKENIPCTTENSYVIINPVIAPSSEWFKYNGRNFVETRGLWEAYNDFMGGPYVSHSFISQDGSKIVVLDAFVYAPRYNKRNYVKQVESIIYSFEWAK